MGYVGPRGIPLSTFLGWDQQDQDEALAWVAYEAARCRRCGHHPDEGASHAHVNVCPGCVETDRLTNSDDLRDVRGAHVHLTAGDRRTCQRCSSEDQANRRG